MSFVGKESRNLTRHYERRGLTWLGSRRLGKRWAAWAAAMIDRNRKDEHQEIRYNWRCCQLRDSPRVGKGVPMLAVLFIGIAGGLALALIAEIVKAAKDARRVNKLVKQLPAVYERYIDAE